MTNADVLPALNIEQAYQQWREQRWTTEWGGVWTPPATSYEREVWHASWQCCLSALAEAGLIRHAEL